MSLEIVKNGEISSIEPGSQLDDAQYFYFITGKNSNKKSPLFEVKFGNKVMKGFLRGEAEITNYKGEVIDTISKYNKYLKRGEAGKEQLDFNSLSYIELLDENKKVIDIFFSLGDTINFIKEEYNQG